MAIHPLRALAALSACALAAPAGAAPDEAAPAPATRRSLPAGAAVGSEGSHGSHAWLGLPFAQPPVGEMRWKAPRPLPPWAGTVEALESGVPCPQFATPLGGVTDAPAGELVGSESCLTLDVWAPPMEPGEVPEGDDRLPVMVWIHGGGNVIGHSGFYDGGNLAASENVIVVAIQYRLGPFGWLRHPAFAEDAEFAVDASGNYGTLDQVAALSWVQANIAAFGGDPGNVTIFGESAGGHDVFMLLLSPLAEGLFHRAIAQSGGTELTSVAEAQNRVDAEEPGAERSSAEVLLDLLVADGRAASREEAVAVADAMPPEEIAGFLRTRSTQQIMSVYKDEGGVEGMVDMPKVFADGVVLPSRTDSLSLFAGGQYHQVPVMLGTNRDENKLFLYVNPVFVRMWFGILPQVLDWERYESSAEHLSRQWKANGADEPAMVMRRVQGSSVYAYRWDWDEEGTFLYFFDVSRLLGAAHAFEIPFVFGHWDLGPQSDMLFSEANREGREILSGQMMSYWAEFARSGAPGRGGDGDLPEWQAWDPAEGGHKFLVLDTPADGGLRMGSEPVTMADVLAGVEADPRLETQQEKCFVYAQLARWGSPERFGPDDYPTAGPKGCAPYPLEDWPWE